MSETTAPTGLQADGFRFVGRGGEFRWVHKLETLPDDLDCTDMTDAQFAECVVNAITRFRDSLRGDDDE